MIWNKKHKEPIELFEVSSIGAKASTAKEVMSELVGKQIETLQRQIATCEPDLGTYAKLAGELSGYIKILKSLDLSIKEAKKANDRLRAAK